MLSKILIFLLQAPSDSAAGGRRPSAPPALRRAVSGGVGVSGNLEFRVQGSGFRT